MALQSKEDPRTVRNRLIFEDASAWVGRIFAILFFMIGPGVAGLWLDRKFGTKFLTAMGFVFGMALGTYVLLILVNVKRPTLEDELADRIDGESKAEDSSRRIGSEGDSRPRDQA
jgi:hypothetical protein